MTKKDQQLGLKTLVEGEARGGAAPWETGDRLDTVKGLREDPGGLQKGEGAGLREGAQSDPDQRRRNSQEAAKSPKCPLILLLVKAGLRAGLGPGRHH